MLAYLILYSGLRFVVEFFRIDSDRIFSVSLAQWISLIVILVSALIWYIKFRRKT